MKTKQIVCLFIALVCGAVLFSLSAFAADNNSLTPYTPGGSQVEQSTVGSSSNPAPDYAGQLFQNPELSQNETVNKAVTSVAKVASALITLVLGVITSILTIQMVIDICCILIKPLTSLLATLPFQVFNDEVTEITGIQYVGNTGEKGSSGTVEKVDLKGKPAFFYYLEKRALIIIPAIIILILLGTGLLFDGVFFIANKVVALVDNALH